VRRGEARLGSLMDAIDWTPIVRLSRISHGLPCTPVAKCGFLSPQGSIDVRAAVRMLRTAEACGRIKPGDTIIEPSRGDTGVGLAMAAAAGGYRLIVTIPEGVGLDREPVLERLGAWVIRTPADAPFDAPEGCLGAARRLAEMVPGAHLLEPWARASSPRAYEALLASEILHQCRGRLDAIVIATESRGDPGGLAQAIRAEHPDAQIVAVEVSGVAAGDGGAPADGTGRRARTRADTSRDDSGEVGGAHRWMRCEIEDAVAVAGRLTREEGLLVGWLSGAAVWAAMRLCEELTAEQTVVAVLPDSFATIAAHRETAIGRRPARGDLGSIGDLLGALARRPVVDIAAHERVATALHLFRRHDVSHLPVLEDGALAGLVSKADVLRQRLRGNVNEASAVRDVMATEVSTISVGAAASEVFRLLDRCEVAVVIDGDRRVLGVVTPAELAELVTAPQGGIHEAP